MKVSVNAPMRGEQITELLCNHSAPGVSFKYLGKTGMRYNFEVAGLEKEAAVALAKKLIRATDYGKVLYFSVDAD